MASSKAPGLKQEQIKKAITALLKHIGRQQEGSKDLLQDEEYLYLVSTRHFKLRLPDARTTAG